MALAGVQEGPDLAISRLFICPSVYIPRRTLVALLTPVCRSAESADSAGWLRCVGEHTILRRTWRKRWRARAHNLDPPLALSCMHACMLAACTHVRARVAFRSCDFGASTHVTDLRGGRDECSHYIQISVYALKQSHTVGTHVNNTLYLHTTYRKKEEKEVWEGLLGLHLISTEWSVLYWKVPFYRIFFHCILGHLQYIQCS